MHRYPPRLLRGKAPQRRQVQSSVQRASVRSMTQTGPRLSFQMKTLGRKDDLSQTTSSSAAAYLTRTHNLQQCDGASQCWTKLQACSYQRELSRQGWKSARSPKRQRSRKQLTGPERTGQVQG